MDGLCGIGTSTLLADRYADARWYSSPARFNTAQASSGVLNSRPDDEVSDALASGLTDEYAGDDGDASEAA